MGSLQDSSLRRAIACALAALSLLAISGRATSAAEPSSNVDDYFAFSFRRMLLKDFHLEAPGCNLGVNCPETGRTCGRLSMSGAVVPAPGQLAGDNVCGPGSFYQVFRNNVGAYCSPTCGMITNPGSGPKCENPFTVPILGDLDHDGQASCDGSCTIDIGDVAAACGVSYPLPACDPSRGVMVPEDSDCVPASLDQVPGNHRCDLAAGTYGMIRVRNRGRINFGEGTTVACTLAVAKAARVTSTGPAQVLIPGNGWASFGNLSDVGGSCRAFKVVTELGPLRFAKHGEFHLDACSLGGTMRLGHDNNLRGRFVSGEFIVSNYNNTGGCCEGPSTTTTTVTSTTSITSASSTTSTSIPGPVCCQDNSQEPPQCGSAPSTADCLEGGGLPGPAGSVCDDDGAGGGRCTDAPPNPGGCCQFDGACAIGGGMDDALCSSLGGAFIADTICSADGNCIAVTTSTTSTTLTTATTLASTTSTIAPTTTVTFTTSTTSTTAQSGPVCCNVPGEPPLCGSAPSTNACFQMGGSPGPVDSICQGAPGGGGSCQFGPPDNPAGCCQLDGSCAIGGELDEVACTSLGGAFVTDAICTASGQCESSSGTTSTTLGTVTTTTSTAPTTSSSVPTTTLVSTTVTSVSTTATSSTVNTTSSSIVSTTSSTAVSTSSSTVTTATSVSSTSNTSTTATSTTVKTTSTTNTTIPGGGAFTRTLGFYKTHPGVTQWILDKVDGVTVCGVHLTNTNYDDAHSALEALCISPQGEMQLQLVRQLTAAALTMAAGGATYTDFTACDTLCASGGGSVTDIGDCITSADNFNNSGDNLAAPFDGFESGSPEYCRIAHATECTVLDPDSCQQ